MKIPGEKSDMSIGAGLALAAEHLPTAISLMTTLRDRFRGSKSELEESSSAIAQAAESPAQLRSALDTLKSELIASNERAETVARELAEVARANQIAVETIALQQKWLVVLSLAVVLAIGLALGALLAG